MQNVTFKYEYRNDYDTPKTYTMEFNSEDMTFDEFLEEVKRFALVMGYHPDTVNSAFDKE